MRAPQLEHPRFNCDEGTKVFDAIHFIMAKHSVAMTNTGLASWARDANEPVPDKSTSSFDVSFGAFKKYAMTFILDCSTAYDGYVTMHVEVTRSTRADVSGDTTFDNVLIDETLKFANASFKVGEVIPALRTAIEKIMEIGKSLPETMGYTGTLNS